MKASFLLLPAQLKVEDADHKSKRFIDIARLPGTWLKR